MSAHVLTFMQGARRGRHSANAGFTLIELMIVVAIVAILASIAIPAYSDSVRKARRAQAKTDLIELTQRAERFYTLNNSYANFWASVPAADRQSPRGGTAYYTLARVSGDSNVNDYVLSATPVGPQTADTACGTLTINQAGAKTKTGSRDLSSCW